MSTYTINTEPSELNIDHIRMQLEDKAYMDGAIERLAWELSLELIEKDYGLMILDDRILGY